MPAPWTPADPGDMWTYRTSRLVPRPGSEVRAAIDDLVRTTWAPFTAVTTTEHHGTRSDWISTDPSGEVLDVVLSWTLTDLDDATYVCLALDELDAGADPTAALEELLDLLTRTVGADRAPNGDAYSACARLHATRSSKLRTPRGVSPDSRVCGAGIRRGMPPRRFWRAHTS